MSFYLDDLADMMRLDEFGKEVTLPGGIIIHGIFRNEEMVYNGPDMRPMVGRQLKLTCQTIDVAGLRQRDVVTIEGRNYKVVKAEDNGFGVTDVFLGVVNAP
jgi:hypothetical protein